LLVWGYKKQDRVSSERGNRDGGDAFARALQTRRTVPVARWVEKYLSSQRALFACMKHPQATVALYRWHEGGCGRWAGGAVPDAELGCGSYNRRSRKQHQWTMRRGFTPRHHARSVAAMGFEPRETAAMTSRAANGMGCDCGKHAAVGGV
jgi:hypothetical protein